VAGEDHRPAAFNLDAIVAAADPRASMATSFPSQGGWAM